MKKRMFYYTLVYGLFFSCSNYKLSSKQQSNLSGIINQQSVTTSPNSSLNFPVIQPVIINNSNAIYGFYDAKNTFAKQFPNFLNDGKYRIDKSYPGWEGPPFFNYKQYPAFITKSDSGLNKVNILLGYGILDAKDYFFYYAKNGKHVGKYFYSQYDQFSCPEGYMITDEAKQIYTKMNEQFKNVSKQYLVQKNAGNITMLNLGSYNYSDNLPSLNTIILEIRHDGFYIPSSGMVHSFLGYHLFTMVVRNAFGDSLSGYHQVIFANAAANGLGKGATIGVELVNQAYANAFPSLVNQFLNDNVTRENMNSFIAAYNNSNKNILNKNIAYGALLSRRRELKTLCEDAKISFDNLANSINNTATSNYAYKPSSDLSASTNQALASTQNLLINLIGRSLDNGEKKLAEAKNKFVKKQVDLFMNTQTNFLDDVAALPESDEKQNLLTKIQQNSDELQEALANVSASNENAKQALVQSKKVSANYLQNFASDMQGFQNANNLRPSSTITNNSSSAGLKSCPAADQFAQSEKTRLTAMANAGSLKLADTKHSEAAIIRKYISTCPSAFTTKQIAEMQKIAQQADNDANDMERNRIKFKN